MVTDVEMEMKESQNQHDRRVEELWKKLDPQATGELDIKGLQKGLRRIDHPLQNADDMLREVVKVVDTNRDGKIQYEGRGFSESCRRHCLCIKHSTRGKALC